MAVISISILNIYGRKLFTFEKENNTFKDTLEEAVRQGKYLNRADLRNATLGNANLSGANLRGANFSRSLLNEVDLSGADVSGADFIGTDLSKANFSFANLRGANLTEANTYLTIFSNANLEDVISPPIIPNLPPRPLTGYKKITYYQEDYTGEYIVTLEIPTDADCVSAYGDKCRCSKAKVLEIKNIRTGLTVNEITNIFKTPTVYKVNQNVSPDSFDSDAANECSNGIHFFLRESDAINY